MSDSPTHEIIHAKRKPRSEWLAPTPRYRQGFVKHYFMFEMTLCSGEVLCDVTKGGDGSRRLIVDGRGDFLNDVNFNCREMTTSLKGRHGSI